MQMISRTLSMVGFCVFVTSAPLVAQTTLPDTMPRRTQPVSPGQPAGTGLFRDLARGINPMVTEESYGLRNALVTGNVFGGRGFRGSVGYAGERDFRGVTGAEEVDRFLARGGALAPTASGYGTAYERIRLGQDLGMLEFQRTGGGVSVRDVTAPGFRTGYSDVQRQVRSDFLSRGLTTQSLMQDSAEPASVGVLNLGEQFGDFSIEVSALRGVSMDPVSENYRRFGFSFVDAMSMVRDRSRGIEPGFMPHEFMPFTPDRPDEIARRDPSDPRPVTSPVQIEIRRGVLEGYVRAQLEDPEVELAPEIMRPAAERLREDLERLRSLLISDGVVDPDDPDAFDPEAMRERLEEGRRETLRPSDEAEPPSGDAFIRSALRHRRTVESLSDAEQSRFRDLVAEAESLLSEGQYFRAERLFTRALRLAPGHPLAGAGLAHAQLGAGLYLSASFTLRALFANNPEMIDVRYAEGARPSDERLSRIRGDLRRELAIDRNRAANGVMLAYVGHLTETLQDITDGLDAAAAAQPGDPLIELLRRVWLP